MNRRRYLALPPAATSSLGGWGRVSSPGEQDASPGGAHHRTPKAGEHKPQHSAALTGLEQGNTHCSSGSRAQSVPGVSMGRAAWLPDTTPTAARLPVVSQGVTRCLPQPPAPQWGTVSPVPPHWAAQPERQEVHLAASLSQLLPGPAPRTEQSALPMKACCPQRSVPLADCVRRETRPPLRKGG